VKKRPPGPNSINATSFFDNDRKNLKTDFITNHVTYNSNIFIKAGEDYICWEEYKRMKLVFL